MSPRRALLALGLVGVMAWGLLLAAMGMGFATGWLPRLMSQRGAATVSTPGATATLPAPAPTPDVAAPPATLMPGTLGPAPSATSELPSATVRSAIPPTASRTPRVVTATPAAPVAGPVLPAAVDWPATPDLTDRRPLKESPHFRVFPGDSGDALLKTRAEEWADRLEAIYDRDRQQLGGRTLSKPVNVVFMRRYEARCPARGLAATRDDPPLLMVFIDDKTSAVQIEAVLAHEIAHHLSLDDRFVGDGILTEGIANWGGGQAVLRWQEQRSWADAVRGYWRQGLYISIADDTGLQPRAGEDCIARRDRVYNIRTAFVDWLIARIGLDRVLAMPAVNVVWTDPGRGEAQQRTLPDYEAATGDSLGRLEQRFLRSLGLGGPEAMVFQLGLELQGIDVE